MLENRSSADSHVTAYRPDLDGLRAIAVLAVIAYHLPRPALPGGYLGVDVFFVLSGYLITSIIWREVSLGQFSIAGFYNRRIRRIMPALLLVVLCTAAASVFILLPVDLVGFARSVFAALVFVPNVYFWRDTNYFSRLAEEKPLLHLWSLGIEEQFYLLFPLLLVLLARFGRKQSWGIIAAMVAASLAANFIALRVGGALPAFYLLPARAWELGVGALLAIAPQRSAHGSFAVTVLGLTGAALVALGLTMGRSLVPEWAPEALIAVAGTGLLIWSGSGEVSVANRLLSSKGLVFIGLISYSLYLWHWPIIVLLKYFLVRDLTVPEMAAAAAMMAACATLSWRYVERPARSLAMPIRTVHLAVGSVAALTAMVGTLIIVQGGFPERLDLAAARINASVGTNYRCPVSDYLYFSQSRACELNLPTRDPQDSDLVLFGNSHAQMYAPLVRDVLVQLGKNGLLVPMNGCTPTADFNISAECRGLATRNLQAIAALSRVRVVVLATTWPHGAAEDLPAGSAQELIAALDATIDHLVAAGKQVVLIGPISTPGWDVASVVSRKLAFGWSVDSEPFQTRLAFEAQYGLPIDHFDTRTDVEFVRPDLVQCPADRCEYVMEGESLFADSSHIAVAALPRFRARFDAALKRAFEPAAGP